MEAGQIAAPVVAVILVVGGYKVIGHNNGTKIEEGNRTREAQISRLRHTCSDRPSDRAAKTRQVCVKQAYRP